MSKVFKLPKLLTITTLLLILVILNTLKFKSKIKS